MGYKMDEKSLKKVIEYVKQNPGCTWDEIIAALSDIKDISSILTGASEGVRAGEGYILQHDGGKFYPGPNVDLAS